MMDMCAHCTAPATDIRVGPGDALTPVCHLHVDSPPVNELNLRPEPADEPAHRPAGRSVRIPLLRWSQALLLASAASFIIGLTAALLSFFGIPYTTGLSEVLSVTMAWTAAVGVSLLIASLFAPR